MTSRAEQLVEELEDAIGQGNARLVVTLLDAYKPTLAERLVVARQLDTDGRFGEFLFDHHEEVWPGWVRHTTDAAA